MKNYFLSSWNRTSLAGLRPGVVLLFMGAALLSGRVAAQCTNNTLSVRTYDTVLTGSGNGTYHIAFPKWRIDSGLLVSVKISATVNLQYSYTLKNTDVTTGTYGIYVGREDYFTSASLTSAYDNLTERSIGTHTLAPGDQVSVTPFAFLTNYVNADSVYGNTAPFLGVGSVNFTYSPITYTNMHAVNNVSYRYTAAATDVTHFTISYLYCSGDGVLATDLAHFTASASGSSSVQLNWGTAMEQRDRTYEIQRSGDGQTFATIGRREAGAVGVSADYTYVDKPSDRPAAGTSAGAGGTLAGTGQTGVGSGGAIAGAGDKWYYRLRLVSPAGISYSSIQSVILSGVQAGLLLYPNPTVDHINLRVPGDPSTPGDWLVNIRAADGRLVQSATFLHSNNLFVFFHQRLAAGVYFVRITDLQGRNARVTSFRVDHL